jgi:hypothetical protein
MNTMLKGGLAAVIGGKSLRVVIVPIFLALFLTCLLAAAVVAIT